MRYQSLRLLSFLYHAIAIVGVFVVLVFFVVFFVGAIGLVNGIAQMQGIQPTLPAYAAALAPPFYFLVAGMLGCLVTYAGGTFIMLMIDIEQGIRDLNPRPYQQYVHEDVDPVTPKPWASFPDYSKQKKTTRPSGDERARIPRDKWDMGH